MSDSIRTELKQSTGFCRDCLADVERTARRCLRCGSPRLVRHTEWRRLALAHIDCDAFYASVEKRDNPDLADKAVIIGGGTRGVVSTACYIARVKGVRSAMPMFQAMKLCPDAVVISPNMEKYVRIGRAVREKMLELTPLVEPISIDEAFLDLNGTERLHGAPPAIVLARFAKAVEKEIGITISVGLSYCKFLAKVASDMNKPRGFSLIGREEALSFLAEKPVTTIWGVGKVFAETLAKDGIRTIGQLQTMERFDLQRRYGSMGERLYRLSRGEDSRRVEPESETKSISSETTFNKDISDLDELVPILRHLSEKVSRRLKASELTGQTVVLKLKSADFRLRTRNRHLPDPTRLADRIFSTGLDLLRRETDGTFYRLIGIGVTDLQGDDGRADPPDLIDTGARKRAMAEGAIDALRNRFGQGLIETGYTFGKIKKAKNQKKTD